MLISQVQGDRQLGQALEELVDQLRSLLCQNLLQIRLYGSWARQQADPSSDVDLAVVVQHLNFGTWQEVYRIVAQLSLRHDLVLSVNLLSQQEWEELQRLRTLYARNLQEEGVLL